MADGSRRNCRPATVGGGNCQAVRLALGFVGLAGVTTSATPGLAVAPGRFLAVRLVLCGVGRPPHGDVAVVMLGAAAVACRIAASVVTLPVAAAAPAEGWPTPAAADGLPLGVGVVLPVPDGVGDGEPVGDGDPEPLGVGDDVWLGDVDGELDGLDPDGTGGGVRHGKLTLAWPDGAARWPVPVLGKAELEPPATPLPPGREPPPPVPRWALWAFVGEMAAGTSMATYAPTATMNTAMPNAVSGRSKLNGPDWPLRDAAPAGSGSSRPATARSWPANWRPAA